MNRYLLFITMILLSFSIMSAVIGTTVYNNNQDITSQVGGSRYWASSITAGSGGATSTRVQHSQDNGGSKVYRPGSTNSGSLGTISSTPAGYGWATDFALTGDIPAGTWNFQVTTRNSRTQNNPTWISVNVFKYCSGTNTQLFSMQGATNAGGTTNNITQIITTSQPAFTANGCRLKFEYWVTIPDVVEDNTNTMQNVATSNFYADFPTPAGGGCQDADGDGYAAASCGGNDCNDANPSVHPGATETCNNIDDNCNGQIDEGISQPATCGIGACSRTITQTCNGGQFTPSCVPGNPITEICNNGIDDNCNGIVDDPSLCTGNITGNNTGNGSGNQTIVCTSGQVRSCTADALGSCSSGTQSCVAGNWASCMPGSPVQELCNGLDDDCNGIVDDGIPSTTAECGQSACRQTVTQTCIGGVLAPVCAPLPPSPEICNNRDDDCNGIIDDGISQACGNFSLGECKQGITTCHAGVWSTCTGEKLPTPEICDFKDNNCNGQIDEGNVCLNTTKRCIEDWQCSDWTSCLNQKSSTRDCNDANNCSTAIYKPAIYRDCVSGAMSNQLPSNTTSVPPIVFKDSTVLLVGSAIILALGLGLGAMGYLFKKDKEEVVEEHNADAPAVTEEGKKMEPKYEE